MKHDIYVAVTRTRKHIFLYINNHRLVFFRIPKIPKKKLSKRYVNNILNGSISIDAMSLPVTTYKIFDASSFLLMVEHYFEADEKLIHLYEI